MEYFEATVERRGKAEAVDDGVFCYSWLQLQEKAQKIGSALAEKQVQKKPVPVVMDKSADTLAAFLGIVYAGGFYVLVNPEYPGIRIEKILETLDADILLADHKYYDKIRECGYLGEIMDIAAAGECEVNTKELRRIRSQAMDTDILYGIFTSGSTGTPKGVIVSHRAVMDFIGHFIPLFGVTDEDVIGNQAPFDFDVSVKDIYSSLFAGAKLVLIPKHMFSMPPSLLDYLCEKRVTTLIWAVSALCMVTTLRGFEYRIPSEVKRVLFSGEVMPYKHLKAWMQALPDAQFVNLYGPSEITCNCTYYKVTGKETDEKALPIGSAFPNRNVFLLDDKNREIRECGAAGEICVSGISLALGYYNNPEATARSFVPNPLNSGYPETIYRTGDIGYYNEQGELCFSGRSDFQVKRMGHRIELEEIQIVLERMPGVERACCIYGEDENKLVAFYQGDADKKELRRKLKAEVPGFMVPDAFVKAEEMPLTKNGKIDRKELWKAYRREGNRK